MLILGEEWNAEWIGGKKEKCLRKKILLRYFGSLDQIKRASIQDLSEVSGIGENMAKSIFRQLHE